MKRVLLPLLLFISSSCVSQEVRPIVSEDYLRLIRPDSLANAQSPHIPANSFKRAIPIKNYYPYGLARAIIKEGNSYVFYPHYSRKIGINLNYNSKFTLMQANKVNKMQNQYAQGRNVNGIPEWQGPETNDPFSYGPLLQNLEFDGTSYPYDINGRLVPTGSGIGKKAIAYPNSILQNPFHFTQQFHSEFSYLVNESKRLQLQLSFGTSSNPGIIKNLKSTSHNFSSSLKYNYKKLQAELAYYSEKGNDNSNSRNGYNQRIYQAGLLTPSSFNNKQAITLGVAQRSFSHEWDNPYYLLENNLHKRTELTRRVRGNVNWKSRDLELSILPSFERRQETGREGYTAGVSGYPDELNLSRFWKQEQTSLSTSARAPINFNDYDLKSNVQIKYQWNKNLSRAEYSLPQKSNSWSRTIQEYGLQYDIQYRGYLWEANVVTGLNSYVSNSTKNYYTLPFVSGKLKLKDVLPDLAISFGSNYLQLKSEPSLLQSYGFLSFTQFTAESARLNFPTEELQNFRVPVPEDLKRWEHSIKATHYGNFLSFTFGKEKKNNAIFPIWQNGNILFQNIGNYRQSSYEIALQLSQRYQYNKKFYWTSNFSFVKWNNKVTAVQSGNTSVQIAGFSDLQKVFQVGAPVGSFFGTSFLRNEEGGQIIGADGFPLVDPVPKIIGNTVPDFVFKTDQQFRYKEWQFQLALEWRKGGNIWNGTAAITDYYGRSDHSAKWRNTDNYIFPGVLENGLPNTIPVKFNDPLLPVTQNRWTRYGVTGVHEAYLQDADHIRLNTVSLSRKIKGGKQFPTIQVSASVHRVLLWSAYSGVDAFSSLYNNQNANNGIDLFTLPDSKSYSLTLNIQF